MKEVRCAPPPENRDGYETVDQSEHGFRIREIATGKVYRCHIGWNGRSNWFLQQGTLESELERAFGDLEPSKVVWEDVR